MDPFTAILINIIIGVILSAASTLLQQAFAPKRPDQQRRTGTRGSALFGGKVPQYFLVGTVGEAGKREYRNAWGSSGGVPNAYLTDVYSFGDLPGISLIGLFVNGVRVTVSETGAVAQGYPVPEYSGHLWWKFLNGSQTTADSYLVDKFGGDADRAWTSEMIGRGVPVLITTALWSETLWTSFPEIVGEFQGIPLYDPRQDDTAGGEGDQRWDDPSTWAFSDNNAVIIYNIERGIYYDGAKIWGGSSTAAQLPYDVWAAAMDACDEQVALDTDPVTYESRFRAGRRINLNERPADVIKELLIACNGRISHAADGTVYVLVGVPDEADAAFSDADVLATEPLGSIPFPNLDEVINGATATYREPAQAWEDKETAPFLRSDLVDEDDGREHIDGLDLGVVFSGTQAQRILKAVIEEGRRFRRHVVALPPEFAIYRPLSVLEWTSDRFDYEDKMFLVTARTISPWGQVILGLQEIDPADHDWNPETDEHPLSFAPVVTNRPAPQEVSGPSVEPVPGTLAYDVFWSAPSVAVDVQFVRVSHRKPDDEGAYYTVLVPLPDLLTGSARIPVGIDLNGTAIEVQLEYLSFSGRETVASAWMPVTIANVTLPPGMVELGDLASEVLKKVGNTRNLIERFKQMGTLLEEVDRENFTLRNSFSREVMVQLGELSASFTEVIEVALGPGGAVATRIDALYAAMGGNSAQINTRWNVEATEDGYGASYGLQLAVDADGVFRAATMFADVPADTDQPTRWGFMAGQFVWFTSEGIPLVAMNEDGRQVSANGVKVIDWVTGAESTTIED